MTNDQSRRAFLIQGAAAASSIALMHSSVAAQKVRIRHPNSPAGASGSFWIGGDLQVNRMGFGCAEFTSRTGILANDPKAIRTMVRRAVDVGVNLLDTADFYGPYISERFIYDALYPYPADLVIETKGGQVRGAPGGRDGRPEYLRSACEASMKRLRLEQVPLYYLHYPDPKVPYEDSIGELARLQKEGKIRHIGISNVNLEQVNKARSLVKVVAVQNPYNILSRQSDDILALCEREHIAFIPYSPLGGRTAPATNGEDSRLAGLQALATEHQISMPQAVIAWLLAKSPVMLAIPGTSRIDHMESNVAAAKVHFTRQEMSRIG